VFEVNFDSLVGPTHNYSGLAFGNLASARHRFQPSNPREAALQGLSKMKFLFDLGLKQGVFPPRERPNFRTLRRLGFKGSEKKILERASGEAPEIFHNCCSASGMWAANSATVAPSCDTKDGKVHFTSANLVNKFHRMQEAAESVHLLKTLFTDERHFKHHGPLPRGDYFGDEGAANHSRFCAEYGKPGVHLFVFGKFAFRDGQAPARYPARQTFEACQAIARLHGLTPEQTVFAQQNPQTIDRGIFHNDVISVGNKAVFFLHEMAFIDTANVLKELNEKFQRLTREKIHFVLVRNEEVSVEESVSAYLFNSQLVTCSEGSMALIAPEESRQVPSVKRFLDLLIARKDSPIAAVHYLDLRQSMSNGGGPACLRLRVELNSDELKKVHPEALLTERRFAQLEQWIKKNYRDRLVPSDLADSHFVDENRQALEELTQLLKLGSFYDFQKGSIR
jgi:succinylarginine dihydrolase